MTDVGECAPRPSFHGSAKVGGVAEPHLGGDVVRGHARRLQIGEQPAAISLALAAYFAADPPSEQRLQRAVDKAAAP